MQGVAPPAPASRAVQSLPVLCNAREVQVSHGTVGNRQPALLEVLRQVAELAGVEVVGDALVLAETERAAGSGGRLLRCSGLLLCSLGRVAGDPLALALLRLRRLAPLRLLAQSHAGCARHAGSATTGHLLHHLAGLEEPVDQL